MKDGIDFDGLSRRSALKTIAGVGIGSTVIGSVAGTGQAMVLYEGGGADDPWKQHDKARWGQGNTDSYTDRHLGSGLQAVSLDPDGTSTFRVAGNFCIVGQDGNIPEVETHIGTGRDIYSSWLPGVSHQKVRIHNESPDGISIATFKNDNEKGMNPAPANGSDDTFSDLSSATGAASLATAAVNAPATASILSATSLVAGMVSIAQSFTRDPYFYEWSGYYSPGGRPSPTYRGGHHVNFGIKEHGGGTVWVASEIADVVNSWRLHINDGLRRVEEL